MLQMPEIKLIEYFRPQIGKPFLAVIKSSFFYTSFNTIKDSLTMINSHEKNYFDKSFLASSDNIIN